MSIFKGKPRDSCTECRIHWSSAWGIWNCFNNEIILKPCQNSEVPDGFADCKNMHWVLTQWNMLIEGLMNLQVYSKLCYNCRRDLNSLHIVSNRPFFYISNL